MILEFGQCDKWGGVSVLSNLEFHINKKWDWEYILIYKHEDIYIGFKCNNVQENESIKEKAKRRKYFSCESVQVQLCCWYSSNKFIVKFLFCFFCILHQQECMNFFMIRKFSSFAYKVAVGFLTNKTRLVPIHDYPLL